MSLPDLNEPNSLIFKYLFIKKIMSDDDTLSNVGKYVGVAQKHSCQLPAKHKSEILHSIKP